MFDGVTYSKGACVLHTLRGLLGDDAWWKGIRGYVAAHKFQVVDTDDFRKAMEAASGKDLKWFFDQWVYKAGHPELKVRWHFEDADKTVRVRIQQTQTVDEQTPLFRLPTTLEITRRRGQDARRPHRDRRGLARVRDPGRRQAQDGPDRPPGLADQGARLRERRTRKTCSSSSTPRAFWAGCKPGRHWSRRRRTNPQVARALAAAWKREKSAPAQREMCELICNGDETFRTALIDAAKAPKPASALPPIAGLAKLNRDDASEEILRAAWTNPKEAYGARKAALRGLVAWKVKDADELLADALKVAADHHSIAATALDLMLETPGAKVARAGRALQSVRSTRILAILGHRGILAPGQGRPASPGHPGRAGRRSRPLGAVSRLECRARPRSKESPAGAGGSARS